MKRALKRRIGKSVYLFLPYGLCLTGKLHNGTRNYIFTPDGMPLGKSHVQFVAKDVVAVNKWTGDAFCLAGGDYRHLAKL